MKNPFGGMGDLSKMMQAAREMQDKVEGLQKSLDEITVTGEAGAGLVRATATAKGDLTGLDIDPDELDHSIRTVGQLYDHLSRM